MNEQEKTREIYNQQTKTFEKIKQLEKWKLIVRAVFIAEHEISNDWAERLKEASKTSDMRVADEYVAAVASEILRMARNDRHK